MENKVIQLPERIENMLDYVGLADKYRPVQITTLLIGEAPPPNGKNYFYLPEPLKQYRSVKYNQSLPATIFNHYFKECPVSFVRYIELLEKLKAAGIFLIDLYDLPLQVRGNRDNQEIVIKEIEFLNTKLESRRIFIEQEKMVFLLARNGYDYHLKKNFPRAKRYRWIDFRMNPVPLVDNKASL